MKKRIQFSMMFSILSTMLIILLISMIYISNQKIIETRQSLKSNMILLAQFTEEISSESDFAVLGGKLQKSFSKETRITFIGKGGQIYYDNKVPIKEMSNHKERPEFVNAQKYGYGEDIRDSQSTGIKTIYTCLPLNKEIYVRMSMPLNAVKRYVYGVMPQILGVCAVLAIIAIYISNRLSIYFVKPYKELESSLSNLLFDINSNSKLININKKYKKNKEYKEYEELLPIIKAIKELDLRLQEYVRELKEKSHEIESILAAVDDGIIVLNRNLEVLTINQKANELFPTVDNFGQTCRNALLVKKIKETIDTGMPCFLNVEILKYPEKTFRCLVSPAKINADIKEEKENVYGVVVSISDITEIKKLERMRSEFVSNFSHEMKSPLTSIKGFAELLKNNMITDPEKVKQYLSIIITESTRMVNLIQDMLKLSELEIQSKDSLKYEQVQIREVINNICTALTFQIEAKEISLEVDGTSCAFTDKEKLSETLLNILDNAVKYNKLHGKIRVKLWESEDAAYVSVWDSGIGIPRESIERIFERFYRVDKARSRKAGSTGLGLSIVKHNAELLGGVLEVDSQQGEYTKIIFHIKKRPSV